MLTNKIFNASALIKGGYIAQCSGELLTISWNYQTMEEFIDATL